MEKAYKQRPLCLRNGLQWKLNEEHVITRCPALDYERKSLGVAQYLDLGSQTQVDSYSRHFKDCLGGEQCPGTDDG